MTFFLTISNIYNYFSSRKKWFSAICILTSVLITSCSSSSTDSKEDVATDKTVVKEKSTSQENKKKSVSEPETLTNKNIEEHLLAYGEEHPETVVLVKTRLGNIKIRLYKDTPLHRANFLMLVNNGYFNETWFYRVSEGHVVQAGNNDDFATPRKRSKIGDYTIPAEFNPSHIHKTGAVAAARSYKDNPDKRTDPFEFYINLGYKHSLKELRLKQEQQDISLTDYQKDIYSTTGGSPHLDGEHTVFGEVLEGMDVVFKISKVRVDDGDWPLENIPIEVEIVK